MRLWWIMSFVVILTIGLWRFEVVFDPAKLKSLASLLGFGNGKVIPILCTGCGNSIPTAPSFCLECPLLYFGKSLATFIFLKVMLFSSYADYLCKIMLLPPSPVSTVPHRTLHKVEVNLPVYFLYLLALNKVLLIFYKSVWDLSVNILWLCFGNQD